MLVGLPESGKSWLAEAIAARREDPTVIISQDDAGLRKVCEAQFRRAYKDNTLLILDRCQPDSEDRQYWMSLLIVKIRRVVLTLNLTRNDANNE